MRTIHQPQVEQTNLIDVIENPHFNGPDYTPELDHKRLTGQLKAIRDYMLDGKHRTLQEIASSLGYPEASVSANLRHLRKDRFGAFTLNKRRRPKLDGSIGSTFEYQVVK